MLKIKLESHQGYFGEKLKTLKESITLLENTLNGQPFKEKVLNFKSDKTEGGTFHFIKYKRRRRINLKRYSNQEIYDKIMEGNEVDGTDCLIVLNLTLKDGEGGSTVGYREHDGIYTYQEDFKRMTNGKIAAHLFHEYMHLIGFKHSKKKKHDKLRDCYSVPYALGNIIEILTTGQCTRECDY